MDTKKQLIKRWHTLLNSLGIDSATKSVLLAQYGVTSSTELETWQLKQLCDSLQKDDPRDAARKRLLKILKEWAHLKGTNEDNDYLKGFAERAAGGTSFNQITLARLNSLYNAFLIQTKDMRTARNMSAPQAK